jgi:ubiquinone/menaquinone biosynthesis C-methylase UbiE
VLIQSVRLLAVAILTGCVAATVCLDRARAADADRFPMPDRPVASVISPAYSSEELRDRHGEAERVLNRLGIRRGMRVADIGAGEGYYTVRLARRLGEAATIYAEDIDGEYLQRLESRLRRERMSHVRTIRGEPRDPKLPRAAVDVAILAHMYHEIENPYEFLYRLWDSLDAGARVAVVDVDKRTENHGTPPALLRCEMAAVGFRQVDFTVLAPADGYLAVFVPPDALPSIATIRPCPQ